MKKTYLKKKESNMAAKLLIAVSLGLLFSLGITVATSGISQEENIKMTTEGRDKMVPVIVLLKDQYKPSDKLVSKDAYIQSMKSFAESRQKDILTALRSKEATGSVRDIKQFWIVNAVSFKATPEVIEEIKKRPDVAKVELDRKVRLLDLEEKKEKGFFETFNSSQTIKIIKPGEPSISWGIEWIEAPQVWVTGINGSGINVSVVDTGINASHPDLLGKVIKWMDFVNNESEPYDDNGHGTHVAGTIAGTGASGIKTGVAPGANLFGVKVFNYYGEASISDVIEAFQWSAENGADVINYSGGSLPLETLEGEEVVSAGSTNSHVIQVKDSYDELMESFKPAFIAAYVESMDLQNLSISLIAPNGTAVRGDYMEWLVRPGDQQYVWIYKYSESRPLPEGNWSLNVSSLKAETENHFWYSGKGNNLNNTLSHSFDLTGVTNATLSFWTKYEMEPGYDYGYVEISVDGVDWDRLATYNGFSGPKVESIDLSSYAGQNVSIRFRYETDYSIEYEGWFIDNIQIPEIDFYDDVESGEGSWSSDGWTIVKEPNEISYRYRLLVAYPDDGTSAEAMAVNNIVDSGVVVVIAAGNDGELGLRTISSPGSAIKAITVGATDYRMDYIAPFSSRGPVGYGANETVKPDVVAPGVSIMSTSHYGGYVYMSGTSMATPHVAGTVALMLQANSSLTPADVKRILKETSFDLGKEGEDNSYGAGRINAYRAVSSVITLEPKPLVQLYAGCAKYYHLQNQTVTITAISWNGLPVSGTEVRFVAKIYNYTSYRYDEILNTTNVTNEFGLATASFVPADEGSYRIEISDEHGNTVIDWIYVAEPLTPPTPEEKPFDTPHEYYIAKPNTTVEMKYTLVTPDFRPYEGEVNLVLSGYYQGSYQEVFNVTLTPINGTISYDLNLSEYDFDDTGYYYEIYIKNGTTSISGGNLDILREEHYVYELYPHYVRAKTGDRIPYIFKTYSSLTNSPAPDSEYTVTVYWLREVEVKSLAEKDSELTNKLMSLEDMTKEEELKLLGMIKEIAENYTSFNIATRNGIATFEVSVPENVYRGYVSIGGFYYHEATSLIVVDETPWFHHTAAPKEDIELNVWTDWEGEYDHLNGTVTPYDYFTVYVYLRNETGPIGNAEVYLYTESEAKKVVTDGYGWAQANFNASYNASIPYYYNEVQVVGLYDGVWDYSYAYPPFYYTCSHIDASIDNDQLNILVQHRDHRCNPLDTSSILKVDKHYYWRSGGTLVSKYIEGIEHQESLGVGIGEYCIRDIRKTASGWDYIEECVANTPLEILTPIGFEYPMNTVIPIEVHMKGNEAGATVYLYEEGTYNFEYLNVTTTDENGNATLYLKVPSKGDVDYEIGGSNSSLVFVAKRGYFIVREQVAPKIVSYTITNRTIACGQTTKINVSFSELVQANVGIEDQNRDPVRTLFSGEVSQLEATWDGKYANGSCVPTGTYYVNVTGTNTTTGLKVVNNKEKINVSELKPDLTGQVEVPSYIKKYKNDTVAINATFKIENIGIADTTGEFVVRAEYSGISADLTIEDRIPAGGSIEYGFNLIVGPEFNDTQVIHEGNNYTIIANGNISLGIKTINVSIDAENNIEELDEDNNNITVTTNVTRPDLVPILTVPVGEVPPMEYSITAGVKNIGLVYAEPTELRVVIENESSVVYSHSFSVPVLNPNDVWNTSFDFNFTEGRYNVTVTANSNNSEAETDYGNNIIKRQITVVQLSPVNVTLSSCHDVSYGETCVSSIEIEGISDEHPLGSLSLTVTYDPRVAMAVGNSSDYNVNITTRKVSHNRAEVLISGSGLNLNGTVTIANITFKSVDDTGKWTGLNLSGWLRSVEGYNIPMNVSHGVFSTVYITDLRPRINCYPTMIGGGDNTITVYVENMRHTSSHSFSLNVSVFNATTGSLETVLLNESYPGIPGYGGRTITLIWNAQVSSGDYWINATLYNDTIEDNNKASIKVSVEEYKLDVHYIWYPYWDVRRNTTFWIGAYFYASHPGYVNASIELPDGLELVDEKNKRVYAWASYWNSVWWEVKGTVAGEYGNQTTKRISINVEAMGKSDTITTDESPTWKLRVVVPRIWVYSINSTLLNGTGQDLLLFKTLNVTTYEQHIRITVQAGMDGRTLSGLDYLVNYPYGCVEQTTSAMLGALHTDEYYRGKGAPSGYDYSKVNGSVRSGISRLAIGGERGQHENGAWSMWGNYPPGHEFYTVYGSYGLGRVKQDDWFGGNVTIGDGTGNVNFSKTVEWLAGKLIDTSNGSYWYTASYYPGTVRITAFGMISHYQMLRYGELTESAKETANESMKKTTEYLLWAQNSSGGWGEIYWSDSGYTRHPDDAMSTALAVWALKLYGTNSTNVSRDAIERAIDKGMKWLMENQKPEGFWEVGSSYYWDNYGLRSETTSLALLALNESQSIGNLNFTSYGNDNETMMKGINYLISTYRQKGSWGYTRATQSAIYALTKLQPAVTSDANVSVSVDRILIGTYRVNESNPRISIELNETVKNSVMNNVTLPAGGKRYWHTVSIFYESGSGSVIVSVANEQFVAEDEVVGEIVGQTIMGSGERNKGSTERSSTKVLMTNLDEIKSESAGEVEIDIRTPDVEGSGVVEVEIRNNNDTVLLSPIVEIPLTGMSFSDVYPQNQTWASNSIYPIPHEYDATNKTLRVFPDEVPAKGSIVVKFNATVYSGENTFQARVTPMYNELMSFSGSVTKYIKGYGNVTVKVYNETGEIDANVTIGNYEGRSGETIKLVEGSYSLRVEKEGYLPVILSLAVEKGEVKNFTVRLYREAELNVPRAVFTEGDIHALNMALAITVNETVKPNATTKTARNFEVSLIGTGKTLISVRVPEYTRGSLSAPLDENIVVTNATSYRIENGMMFIEVDGSKVVQIRFEGRKLGDVYRDDKIGLRDAVAILRYSIESDPDYNISPDQRWPETADLWG